jgi:hypothetical protein
MTIREFCPHPEKTVGNVTWMISRGPQETGPICDGCFDDLSQKLSRYPDAIGSLTIWPMKEVTK